MKIAVTGANGFIGQCVVEQALAEEHDVLAIVRSSYPSHWNGQDGLQLCQCDLSYQQNLAKDLDGCEVLIHLAAQMSGPESYQRSMTMTKNVLSAATSVNLNKVIALSSIAVFDYTRAKAYSLIDENIPLAAETRSLGPYALMKRDQERLFQQWQSERKKSLIILRPGIVYNALTLASNHVGFVKGHYALAASHNGSVPVVHVDTVASAAVIAAEAEIDQASFNLVNDQLPSQRQYLDELKRRQSLSQTLSVPWQVYTALTTVPRLPLSIVNRVPDAFRRNSVAARYKPFNFSNTAAKQSLNWQSYRAIKDHPN